MTFVEDVGLVSILAVAVTWRGAALIAQGCYREGIVAMRRGNSITRATGGTPATWPQCYLAIGLGAIGRPQEGLEVLDEGLASHR